MKYTTDDMRNYAGDASEVALRIGGVKLAMKEAADEIERLRGTLIAAEAKLKLYRAEHSGEYVGGVEYTNLMRQIEEVLTATSK